MQELVILCYDTGEVILKTIPESVDPEDYIEEVLNFNIDECEWMCAEQITLKDDRE